MVAAKIYTCTLSGSIICAKRERLALGNEWSKTFGLYLVFFWRKEYSVSVNFSFQTENIHLLCFVKGVFIITVHFWEAECTRWNCTHPHLSVRNPFLRAFASLLPPPQLCFCYGESTINRSVVLKDKTNMLKGCDPPSDGCLFSLRPIRKSLAVFSPSLNA